MCKNKIGILLTYSICFITFVLLHKIINASNLSFKIKPRFGQSRLRVILCNTGRGEYFMGNNKNLKNEVWRVIPNTNRKYYISNMGRYRSFMRKKTHTSFGPLNADGYPVTSLIIDGIRKYD